MTLLGYTFFSSIENFLPIAQSCAALFCYRLAIRASSLGWLVGNKLPAVIHGRPERQCYLRVTLKVAVVF